MEMLLSSSGEIFLAIPDTEGACPILLDGNSTVEIGPGVPSVISC